MTRLKSLFIVALIYFVLFGGCTTSQNAPASQNSVDQTTQADAPPATVGDTAAVEELAAETAANPGEPAAPAVDDPSPDSILILMAGRVTSLDPYQMVTIHPDNSVASHLWDTLTLLNQDLEIEPSLAETWRLVNNFTWEFNLRQDVTFHNGEPLNAEAVKFSIERSRSMPNSLETFANDVKLERVEIIDDYTLRFTTRQPVSNLPYHLAFLEILPPVYYTQTAPDQLATAPIGSGPYQLAEAWSPGEPVVLEAVNTYWKGAPAVPRLVFRTISQPEERLAALGLENNVIVSDLPPMPSADWNVPGSRLEAIESTQRMFIGLPVKEGSPFADKRVRQALNYGVDVEQIATDWLAGYGERYGSWVNPPGDNNSLAPWPYDPDQARELLAEAGYTQGITTTLRTPVDVYYNDVAIAETIAQQLAAISVTVKIDPVSNWGIYVRELTTQRPDSLFLLGLNSRGNTMADIQNLSGQFEFNPTGWRNNAFEGVLERALSTLAEDPRTRLLDEAQAIGYEEAPWIWLWRSYYFYGISENLNWTPRRDGLINLYTPASP